MKFFSIYLPIFLGVLISSSSCSKKEIKQAPSGYSAKELRPPYDTLPKDSFSPGAIPEEIFQNLRVNSKSYQDSLAKKKIEDLAAQKDSKKKDSIEKLGQKEKAAKKEKDKNSNEKSQAQKETEVLKSEQRGN